MNGCLRDTRTGDTLVITRPDILGAAVVIFNGRVVERVLFSDLNGGSVTLGDGRRFRPGLDFLRHLIAQLGAGAYHAEAHQ